MGYFRFGLRDLLWGMALLGLSLGWWLDHRQSAEAKEDARMIAHFATSVGLCGCESAWYDSLLTKYGASRARNQIVILENVQESELAIELVE